MCVLMCGGILESSVICFDLQKTILNIWVEFMQENI